MDPRGVIEGKGQESGEKKKGKKLLQERGHVRSAANFGK